MHFVKLFIVLNWFLTVKAKWVPRGQKGGFGGWGGLRKVNGPNKTEYFVTYLMTMPLEAGKNCKKM